MSDFLSNIVSRHLGLSDIVEPRQRGMFEPERIMPSLPFIPLNAQNSNEEQEISQKNKMNTHRKNLKENKRPSLDDVDHHTENFTDSSLPETIQPANPDQQFDTNYHKASLRNFKNNSLSISIPDNQKPKEHLSESFPEETNRSKTGNDQEKNSQNYFSTRIENKSYNNSIQPIQDKQMLQATIKGKHHLKENPLLNPFLDERSAKENRIFNKNTSAARSKVENTPTVKVHIGRIEVKTVQSSPVEKKVKRSSSKAPDLSLEKFLKNREGK